MADLAKELEELHSSVVRTVRERIDRGGVDEEGNLVPTSNDDLRVALQLLKQNSITANLAESDTAKLRSRMASKLDFSALKDKPNVVPMVRSDDAATA
ncbi:MAG: uncultured phage MedDCM-OCT-S38-C3 [Cyanobacteriota bacterium]